MILPEMRWVEMLGVGAVTYFTEIRISLPYLCEIW